jgi:hypothetical protein
MFFFFGFRDVMRSPMPVIAIPIPPRLVRNWSKASCEPGEPRTWLTHTHNLKELMNINEHLIGLAFETFCLYLDHEHSCLMTAFKSWPN